MSIQAATGTPPALPTPPPLAFPANDFSDRLSPMLVKELRQGLRARTFVGLFVAVHALLCFILLISISSSVSTSGVGLFISKTILGFLSIALLVIQPLRAIGAVHSEIRSNTIEMMVLTRLGPWRIVLGKWFSLFSQSLLIATSIIPYLILRYFLGGMDLFAELHLIAWIIAASALFITVPLGLSATPNILIRGLAPLAGAVMVCAGITEILESSYSYNELIEGMSLENDEAIIALSIILFIACYFAWNLLGIVTRQIAPISRNLSTTHRLVALVLAIAAPLVIGSIDKMGEERGMIMIVFSLFVSLPAAFIALSEPLHLIPTFSQPFRRFGPLGRIGSFFLYPGWPSGVAFTLVLVLLTALFTKIGLGIYTASYWTGGTYSDPEIWSLKHTQETVAWSLLGYNLVLLSSLGTYPFRKKVASLFTMMILVAVSTGLFALITNLIADELNRDSLLWIACWTPLGIFSFLDKPEHEGVAMVLSISQTVLYSFLLSWLAWRTYRIARREALADPSLASNQA